MRRGTRLATLSTILVLLASACGGGGGTGDGGGTVRLYHDKAPWEPFFQEMGTLAREDAGITLEQTPYSDSTAYQQVIRSSFRTREVPDVFTWWSGERLRELVDSGVAADVSDVWAELVASGDLPEDIRDAYTFDGKQYGLPLQLSYWAIAYNKQLFAEHGVEPPATWEEFTAVADTLKQAQVTPLYASVEGRWPSFIWFAELLIHSDPQLYTDLCDGKASYTDPGVVKVMETWKSMIEKGYFGGLDLSMDNAAAAAFADGQFAMMPIGSWFGGILTSAGMTAGEDYGVFVLPNLDPSLDAQPLVFETAPLVVPERAPDVERSKEFVRWFQTETAQRQWTELLGDLPTNPKVGVSGSETLTTLTQAAEAENTVLMERYWECTPPELAEAAVDGFAKFIVNPGTYMEVLQDLQTKSEQVFAEQGG